MSEVVVGDIVEDGGSSARTRVRVDNLNLQWVYAHFPMAWTFDLASKTWLPELTQIYFRRGGNGQADDSNLSAPKAHVVAKGGTILERGSPRLKQYAKYQRAFPAYTHAKAIGTYYASIWEKPTVIGNITKWVSDEKGYKAFRKFLADEILEPPSAAIILHKIEETQGLRNHLCSLPRTQLREENITKLEILVKGMEESLAALGEDVDETPEEIPEGTIETETETKKRGPGRPRV